MNLRSGNFKEKSKKNWIEKSGEKKSIAWSGSCTELALEVALSQDNQLNLVHDGGQKLDVVWLSRPLLN